MGLSEILQQSQVITDCILQYLDAESLAQFGACNRSCRSLANSEYLWHSLCKRKGYDKFYYLKNFSNHPNLPTSSLATSPIYFQFDTETLCELNEWREVYNRSEHLEFNWQNGVYFVLPNLKGHHSRISAIDSNGSLVVSSSIDEKLIKLWSIEDCECINTIKLRTDSVNCVKLYNQTIVAGGDDGIIRIYDQQEGDLLYTLLANTGNSGIIKLIIVNDQLLAAFTDKTIRAWSLKTYDSLYILRGHEDDIECLFVYDNILVTGSWDNSCIIWDLINGSKLAKLDGHTEVINDIKMKENKIVTASSDATLRVWNIKIKTLENKKNKRSVELRDEPIILQGHSSDIYCAVINREFICSGGSDSTIIVWNFSGKLLHRLNGHLGIVRNLFIDEYKLVSGGDAKKIMIWDYRNGILLNEVHRNPNKLDSMIVTDTCIITESPECRNDFFDITIITYW